MGQRKNGVQHNNLKKINAVVMGKNGVGKTGKLNLIKVVMAKSKAEKFIRIDHYALVILLSRILP